MCSIFKHISLEHSICFFLNLVKYIGFTVHYSPPAANLCVYIYFSLFSQNKKMLFFLYFICISKTYLLKKYWEDVNNFISFNI